MKTINIIVLAMVFSSILLLGLVEAKKKRSTDKRPSDIEPELYCNSCQAIVRQILKKVGESRKEYDIHDALDTICTQKNFVEYEYPPPDMIKGCHAFISGWDEVIETMMIKRATNADIENDICLKRTRACLNVDPNAKQNKGNNPGFVTINDKQVPISSDGSINVNGGDL